LTLELHPLSAIFPRMHGAEFNALRDDIAANGLRESVVILDGQILDGGNRYRACLEVGVDPRLQEFHGPDPVAYVLSKNLHRRHLSPGQQAAIVASAQDWAKAQTRGGNGSNQHDASKAATLPVSSDGDSPAPRRDTVADRAALSGASERTQRMADKVAKADPALAQKVAHGEVSLPQAVSQIEQKAEAPAKPAPTKAIEPAAPPPPAPPAEPDVHDGLREVVDALSRDNARLSDRLAVEAMDASEEEKAAAAELIASLRAENVALAAQLDAARSQLNGYLVENAALKRQCESLLRKMRKAEARA